MEKIKVSLLILTTAKKGQQLYEIHQKATSEFMRIDVLLYEVFSL